MILIQASGALNAATGSKSFNPLSQVNDFNRFFQGSVMSSRFTASFNPLSQVNDFNKS